MFDIFRFIAWTDFLDILVTFLIFYGIYLSIRGTRALQILLGVAVFVLFRGIGEFLQLRLINLLFGRFFDVGLIFLVILFQPELRSGFTNLGQRRFWSLFEELESEEFINRIVRASQKLSRREVGALVAIEREVGLKNYLDTGTEIDSLVTTELLTTLFMSRGPLHDGAVIIRENKIKGAGCVFPLSDRTDLPSNFGTRHRAAVGLAEESDAVVIAISEETGEITLVYKRNIHTEIDIDDLEDYLYTYLNL